jgi:hypothetical protein
METGLYKLGNHSIEFKGKSYIKLSQEIKTTLDNIVFTNAEFLRLSALHLTKNKKRDVKKIREINTQKEWIADDEAAFYNFKSNKSIDFEGPFDLKITFYENKVTFWNPEYSYKQWFEMQDEIHRDEWRKYMFHILSLFGGNSVIYLPVKEHFIQDFLFHKGSFEELKAILISEHGKPKQTFNEVALGINNAYLIDDFTSINWNENECLDKYFPEPNDTSCTDFDLNKYASMDELMKLAFDTEILYHKLIEGKFYFYHIAVLDGLLCIQNGQVDGFYKLELRLDKFAPFTFDELIRKITKEGYALHSNDRYSIQFKGFDSFDNWSPALEEFEKELLWNGIGQLGCESFDDLGVYEKYFYTVNQELALNIIIESAKKYGLKGNMKVVKNEVLYKQ